MLCVQRSWTTLTWVFGAQLDISEELCGVNVKFSFTEKDVRELLQNVAEYSQEEKRIVEAIVCAQIRKYTYFFDHFSASAYHIL